MCSVYLYQRYLLQVGHDDELDEVTINRRGISEGSVSGLHEPAKWWTNGHETGMRALLGTGCKLANQKCCAM